MSQPKLRLLEEQINHERELRERFEATIEKAREIQFNEYERRLAELNHAHERAVEVQRMTVSRETYDDHVREARTAFEAALRNITETADRRATEVERRLGLLEDNMTATQAQRVGQASVARWAFATVAFIGTLLGVLLLLSPLASILNPP